MQNGQVGESAPDWIRQYRSRLSSYELCAEKLEGLIRDLLANAEIDFVSIESRAKDPDSFARKVDGKRESYDSPLEDVTDLIGVRVIAYYLEDVERINEIIAREFDVDEDNSADKLDNLEPDRFGYRSVHHVVSLTDRRARLGEWAVFKGKKAEIQVRTATQHAWAAVEHKLNYKRTSEAPRDLRRRLMRLSALFELADEEFSTVKDKLEKLEAQYSSDVREGNLDLPVDTASVEAFLQERKFLDALLPRAEAAGFKLAPSDREDYRGQYDRDLRDLVSLLHQMEIHRIADLDEILRNEKSINRAIDRLGKAFAGTPLRWRSPLDVLAIVICFQQKAPPEMLESIYRDVVVDALREIQGEPKQNGG